ncbi:MAG: PAS domain-containing protein [Deltaproteobacteria bacterium]|nr:PAS domain-containing protein [Nannocystaceae bacterium]
MLVAGIGFAEGGVEPLQQFFGALREVDDLAFVAISNEDANAPSTLRQLLARVTALAVTDVVDGSELLPGHIYVAPPTGTIAFEDGRVRLVLSNDPRQRIDDGLGALAESFRARAVGVLLSGTGSDGTIGLEGIHRLEGMTMVQDDGTARFEAMPRNAVTTGVVDHVGTPEELAAELVAYAAHVRELNRRGPETSGSRLDELLPEILTVLEQTSSQGLHHYKPSTLARRIARRMQILHERGAEGYLARLRSDPEEADALLREVLIGVTSFFRDPEAFATLGDACIRRIVEDRRPEDQIRVWVPGCATGEEAYSLAILFCEAFSTLEQRPAVQIFATDIDERALAIARKGSYSPRIAEVVSRECLDRFFVRRNQRYQVTQEIREICLFSRHNLVSDPPFSRVDLISCRNVLIYLGPPLQQKLLSIFHYSLRPQGFLFLGPSENIAAHTELFRTVAARQRISQRRSTSVERPTSTRSGISGRDGVGPAGSLERPDLHLVGQRILLDEFAPSYVIVDDQGQILVATSGIERYLEFTDGVFKNNVVRLARPGLRTALRPALAEAIESRRKVVRHDVVLESGGNRERMGLTVQPMPRLGESDDLLMVVFHELPPEREGVRGPSFEAGSVATIAQLEDELAATRDELERSILDLESANEELKSSNEELLSMNEELQAANEELESSKEEIQSTNEALARSNADLENLMNSSEIATIFLDTQLRVQRFSQPVTAIYNLLPLDIGRPLAHITHNLVEMVALPELLVDDDGKAELHTRDGRVLVRRVLPYRTPEGLQEGIVLTFTDVTDLRGHARIIREQLAELERAKLDADAANRAKSDFLANMSHEIRTPMSVVLGYADLLLERVAVPEDRACVETIRRNGMFLLRIVNDILDLSKIEAGTLITEHVRFSPGELLLELRELLDERVRERGLPLRIELA